MEPPVKDIDIDDETPPSTPPDYLILG